jgi:hypothetical protein
MSLFAYVSPICGTNERFELLVFKHRAINNRESLPHRVLCGPAPAETDGAFKTNAEGLKGPADHLALRQTLNPDVTGL